MDERWALHLAMAPPSPEKPSREAWKVLVRPQTALVALFVFCLAWTLDGVLERELQARAPGFPAGFLHALQQLDHLLAFAAAGLLGADLLPGWRWVPAALSAAASLSAPLLAGHAPCANSSILPVIVVAAAVLLLNLAGGRGGAFASLLATWQIACHLHTHHELAPTEAHSPWFALGLAFSAALVTGFGVGLGGAFRERFPGVARPVCAAFLMVLAGALAVG